MYVLDIRQQLQGASVTVGLVLILMLRQLQYFPK